MKHIVTIGHERLAFPAHVNLAPLMKLMAQAKEVCWRHHDMGELFVIERPVRFEIKLVQDEQVIDPKKSKLLPEKAGGPYDGEGV